MGIAKHQKRECDFSVFNKNYGKHFLP